VTCQADYQLNLEDALACSGHDIVVFIDAARNLRRPYAWKRVRAGAAVPAMTHSLGPEAVLTICAQLYGRNPEAHLLAVRGYDWELGEGLSARASANLEAALEFLAGFLARAARMKGPRP
jgi:hydrogenase maturation protease